MIDPLRASPEAERERARREDRKLAEACRQGERGARETLVRTYLPDVTRMVGRLVGHVADLEDLVQQVFVEAMGSIGRFRGEARLRTWLLSIATHVVSHYLRRGRRTVPLEALGPTHEPAVTPDPARALDGRAGIERLHGLLDRLPPLRRMALLLHTVEGLSIAEIAALCGSSRTAVKSRLFLARRQLLALCAADPVMGSLR